MPTKGWSFCSIIGDVLVWPLVRDGYFEASVAIVEALNLPELTARLSPLRIVVMALDRAETSRSEQRKQKLPSAREYDNEADSLSVRSTDEDATKAFSNEDEESAGKSWGLGDIENEHKDANADGGAVAVPCEEDAAVRRIIMRDMQRRSSQQHRLLPKR